MPRIIISHNWFHLNGPPILKSWFGNLGSWIVLENRSTKHCMCALHDSIYRYQVMLRFIIFIVSNLLSSYCKDFIQSRAIILQRILHFWLFLMWDHRCESLCVYACVRVHAKICPEFFVSDMGGSDIQVPKIYFLGAIFSKKYWTKNKMVSIEEYFDL